MLVGEINALAKEIRQLTSSVGAIARSYARLDAVVVGPVRDELESTQGWRRCWIEGMNDVANSFLPAVHGVRVGADVLLAAPCKRSRERCASRLAGEVNRPGFPGGSII